MIYDANNLDIKAVKKDGSAIERYIVSSGKFDDSPQQQTLLMDKIENYMGYILSEEFKAEHPGFTGEQIWIVLSLDRKPSPLLTALSAKILDWVNTNGIQFRVEYRSLFGGRKTLNLY